MSAARDGGSATRWYDGAGSAGRGWKYYAIMRRMATAIMWHFFYAAELPISLKRMAATPFTRCPGQKSKLGALKSPVLRRWLMKLFRVKNTYAPRKQWRLTCVKSSFSRASSDWPGAIGLEVQYQLNDFQIWILFLGFWKPNRTVFYAIWNHFSRFFIAICRSSANQKLRRGFMGRM